MTPSCDSVEDENRSYTFQRLFIVMQHVKPGALRTARCAGEEQWLLSMVHSVVSEWVPTSHHTANSFEASELIFTARY